MTVVHAPAAVRPGASADAVAVTVDVLARVPVAGRAVRRPGDADVDVGGGT